MKTENVIGLAILGIVGYSYLDSQGEGESKKNVLGNLLSSIQASLGSVGARGSIGEGTTINISDLGLGLPTTFEGFRESSQFPEIPKFPKFPEFLEIPKFPKFPKFPGIPEFPMIPGITEPLKKMTETTTNAISKIPLVLVGGAAAYGVGRALPSVVPKIVGGGVRTVSKTPKSAAVKAFQRFWSSRITPQAIVRGAKTAPVVAKVAPKVAAKVGAKVVGKKLALRAIPGLGWGWLAADALSVAFEGVTGTDVGGDWLGLPKEWVPEHGLWERAKPGGSFFRPGRDKVEVTSEQNNKPFPKEDAIGIASEQDTSPSDGRWVW